MSTDRLADPSLSVIIIGAGNVGTHIARRLDGKVNILQIYSRDIRNAVEVAQSLENKPDAIDSLCEVRAGADMYIVAVKDDVIAEVAAQLPEIGRGVVVHTSGSAPDDALARADLRHGVLYPLQTFSKEKDVDWSEITVFTSACDNDALAMADRVGRMLGGKVCRINGEKRSQLHVAAVFACNFVNYMWIKSAEILHACDCDLSVLAPLLKETLGKALSTSPERAQTGPARRGDIHIIDRHTSMLGNDEDAELYRLLSDAIMKHFNKEKI